VHWPAEKGGLYCTKALLPEWLANGS